MVGEPASYPAVANLEAHAAAKKGEIPEVVSDCPHSPLIIFHWMRAITLYGAGYPTDGPTIR